MSSCKCDMAAQASMVKDYNTAMGFQPYHLEGQKAGADGDAMLNMLPMGIKSKLKPGQTLEKLEGTTYVNILAKYDEATDTVVGMMSTDSVDLDQQIADKDWLDQAVPEWFKWGNMRQMHQPIAAGRAVAITATDNGYNLVSKIVNPETRRLWKERVLQAYSIGIKNAVVIKDALAKGGRIVAGSIIETSYVDYPANPECAISIAKMVGDVLTPNESEIEMPVDLFKSPSGTAVPVSGPPSAATDAAAFAANAIATAGALDAAAKANTAGGLVAKDAAAPAVTGANGSIDVAAGSPTPTTAAQGVLNDIHGDLSSRMHSVATMVEALAREVAGSTPGDNSTPTGQADAPALQGENTVTTPPQTWAGQPLDAYISPVKAAVTAVLADLLSDVVTKGAGAAAENPLVKFIGAAVAAQSQDLARRLEVVEVQASAPKGATTLIDSQNPASTDQLLSDLQKAASSGHLTEEQGMKATEAIFRNRFSSRTESYR